MISIVLALAWFPLTAAGAIAMFIHPLVGLVLLGASVADGYAAVATSLRAPERSTA
ncbi:MAG TPA: hypothetical protein VF024_12190 [Solirubrobacteraceae bacterium]